MTPAQVEAAARNRYNASTSTFWSQDEVFKLIYEGELVLATEALAIEGVDSSITTADGTQSYAFPDLTHSIKRAEWNGNKLSPINMREDDVLTLNNSVTTATGTPQYYWIWNETIYLRDIPNAAHTLKLFVFKLPTLLTTASTTLDVPTRCHMPLVDFVVARMAAKDEQLDTAMYYDTKWERYLTREIAQGRKRRRGDGFAVVQNEESLSQTILGSV